MNQFYQSPINSYFKNNKDCITGLIIGLLVLLMIFRQSIGLPLLFIYLIAIGGLVKPRKEYLVIAVLLILKIIIITIICKNNLQDINEPNLKEWFRRIIINIILLFMIFIRLRPSIKKGFYYFCMVLGMLDLICNIYAHIHGVSWTGVPFDKRLGDWIGRSGGLFGHTFYSINISLTALFSALLLKNRYLVPLLLLSAANLILSGSQRGLLALAVIIILYTFFYWRVKTTYIYLASAAIVAAVFLGVANIAAHYPELIVHNERIFLWSHGYEALISSWQHVSNYLRINPEVFIAHSSNLMKSQIYLNTSLFFFNAESYYLSEAVNYGLLVSLLSIIVFFRIYKINSKYNDALLKLTSSKNEEIPATLSPQANPIWVALLLSLFIFLDGFYGYLIGATFLTFFYAMVCFADRDALR
ncbi:O-antigen ligase family protein [Polynucleobacter paneuropaeus]|uniref:hypothetical protein n=1 Tax=Polynucleobacter paneuropaeus TaxID=2527775 RepID=UPI001BFE718C|nr:hypothetical protein [Polynucleobacter paneuropaeus]QWD52905.1 O-antigen ligase family protein [Polynucleobacter paneuropaeus]QWD57819.1 O-antigen ligase family protein [Polynucleobacter paneuropaeus]